MQVRTIFLYLIGNRQAILDIAADRRWLGIGALFVLSAGLAREYDQEDLVHEPWFLQGRLDAHPERTESREFLDRLLKEREKKGFD
jgi:hypothetical protein